MDWWAKFECLISSSCILNMVTLISTWYSKYTLIFGLYNFLPCPNSFDDDSFVDQESLE